MLSSVKLFIALSLVSFASAALKDTYGNEAYLDEGKTYKLYWKIDDVKKEISFAVEVETLGWVGFGISRNGDMVNSDVVIGWVKDNKGYMKDRYATSKSLPTIDEKQDYSLTNAYEKDGKTVMEFSRKYDTCDPKDVKIEKGTVRVIYSYHTKDPDSEDDIPIHTKRGTRSLMLLSILTVQPNLPSDLKDFEMTVNLTVPDKDTLYHCKPFRIPNFNGNKKHVVKVSPILTPGNEAMVHHILIYGCTDDFPVSNLTVEGSCFGSNMPDHIQQCAGKAVVAAWAIGGNAFFYPNHVGYPLGDPQSVKFVVMEIHYDNPLKKAGIKDMSGLRFHYTSQLRQYDADVLWVGWAVNPYMWIPPKQKKWNSVGYCISNCTEAGLKDSPLKEGGIKIFAGFLHSHLLGSALYTKHIRKGKELPDLIRDDYYDFNFQETQVLKEERHILPGDELITHCQYDSSQRTKLTTGGLSTKEEMCLSYMFYYPRVNFTKCVSASYGSYLYKDAYEKKTNKSLSLKDFTKMEWTDDMTVDLQKFIENQTYVSARCEGSKGTRIGSAHRKWLSVPKITDPLPKPDDCSSVDPKSGQATFRASIALVTIAATFLTI